MTISGAGPAIWAANPSGVVREHSHVCLRYVSIAFSTLGHGGTANIGGFLRYDGRIGCIPLNDISKLNLEPSEGDHDGLGPIDVPCERVLPGSPIVGLNPATPL